MPKLKTKKGAAKRFKLTKKGKITHSSCQRGHLLTCKKTARLRRLRRKAIVDGKKDIKYLKRMLPYG